MKNERPQLTLTTEEKALLFNAFPEGLVAFDLETTGLSSLVDKIVEIAAVKITPQNPHGEYFSYLINPGILIPQVTIDIHGITDEMVKDSPVIEDILDDFLGYVGNLPIVAHNARFDIGFLVFAIHQFQKELSHSKVYCSCQLARECLKKMPNFKLGTLVKNLDIPIENHHRALDDAIACLLILVKSIITTENVATALKRSYQFSLGDFMRNSDFEIPPHLLLLKQKVVHQEVVEIKYQGGTIRNIFRPIRPIGLLPVPGKNILYAQCLTSNMFKSFILSKISEVREVPKKNIS
ncbi:MAG: hypothetical protein ISR65_06430 [Bacteriovoracaceae bacterium]|nr:hypothetical protein [Bacteriovoracaceae bacterium]